MNAAAGSSDSASALASQHRFHLPGSSGASADLARDVSQRLQVLSAVVLALWIIYYILGVTVFPRLEGTFRGPVKHQLCWSGIVIASVMFLITRSGRVRTNVLLNLGLGFMITMAGLIAAFNATRAISSEQIHPAGVSWICIWIVLYPMIVPTRRRLVFIAAVVSAFLDPIVFMLAWSEQGRTFPVSHLWHWTDNYVCALLAVVPAHVLQIMNRKVQRARELGSYRLTDLLGRGGMGEVWRAEHSLLARPAAIKIIRAEKLGVTDTHAERMTLRRFEREAQSTAALHSPHTIQVFDFGLGRDGTFYYVMELLAGFDFGTMVKRFGPLGSGRVAHVLAQACHSLHDAHENGLVHRDVKPANLFVCRMGQDFDFVKVLDFGLVRSQHTAEGESIATMHGMTTGTPGFMAPEQIRAATLDGRADLYSLGCVGYWLLTGRLVFEAEQSMQMLIKHVQDAPVEPSKRTEVAVDPELEGIILACLAKKPEARPKTARELAGRLRTCASWSEWNDDLAEEWWRKHAPEIATAHGNNAAAAVANDDATVEARQL